MPSRLCQLTAKSRQDNSTWPICHRDNSLQTAGERAGQVSKWVGRAQSSVSSWGLSIFTHPTATATVGHLGHSKVVVVGGAGSRQVAKVGASYFTPFATAMLSLLAQVQRCGGELFENGTQRSLLPPRHHLYPPPSSSSSLNTIAAAKWQQWQEGGCENEKLLAATAITLYFAHQPPTGSPSSCLG